MDVEFLNVFFKQMPLIFTFLGIFFALYIHVYNLKDYFDKLSNFENKFDIKCNVNK